ncbi:MAG: DUF3168 domain-containing protein [Dehalococcoidales bacterium]|nr:DUF3168 domain-containing protein [Dehalococcoidales bacterium]
MLIEQALMTFLLAQSGITALVGDRIHFVRAPQDVAHPYLVISKVDDPGMHSHDGPVKLGDPRLQFSAFAETYGAAKLVTAAVKTALNGYKGTMGGDGGVFVGGVFYDDETDLDPGDGSGLFGVAADYIIWYQET